MKATFLSKGKVGLAALGLAATALLSSCGGGGGGGGYVGDPYYDAWYDVYGNVCSFSAPGPGCNFYSNGLKIIDIEDPHFDYDYYLQYGVWSYYNSFGSPETYVGWAWQSPNGIIYDDFGDALNNKDGKGRDFAAEVAKQEKNVVKTAGEYFSAKYGMDAATGQKVAKILRDWATLGKDRARTEADIADFTQRLYGLDVNKVKGALAEAMKGEKQALDGLVNEVATNWNTTPEATKEVLKTWYGKHVGPL